jgi:hypothetical protein
MSTDSKPYSYIDMNTISILNITSLYFSNMSTKLSEAIILKNINNFTL